MCSVIESYDLAGYLWVFGFAFSGFTFSFNIKLAELDHFGSNWRLSASELLDWTLNLRRLGRDSGY